MNSRAGSISLISLRMALCALLALACVPTSAHEPEQTSPEPGFRPPSEHITAFLDALGDMSVDVLPTIIRRVDRTAHSFASQRKVVQFLNDNNIATARERRTRIDLGGLQRGSQWEIFQRGLAIVAAATPGADSDVDYTVAMEILVPGDEAVFGVEVYILDRQGRNAFSYLLNSHHQLFAAAGLVASDSSEAARQRMVEKATQTALVALQAQIHDARDCAKTAMLVAPRSSAGILHGFDEMLPTGSDQWGTPLGYSAFSGPDTTVNFSVTDSYPARPGTSNGNRVLQLDLDVSSWGGVIHRFADDATGRWTPYDWHDLDGFSFWFYGANSGTELFLDIMDNRNICSKTDDAERFRYRFWDDGSGWRLIKARFQDLARVDVGNGAPNDGMGLSKVHGWGLGALRTGDPVTFFIDDFRLLDDASPAISSDATRIAHGWLIETQLGEDVSRMEFSTEGNDRPVVERVLDLMCRCALLASDRGFEYFSVDEREALSNNRARFRLTFFRNLPAGVPVQHPSVSLTDQNAEAALSGPILARSYLAICQQ